MHNKDFGNWGEERAAEYLIKKGYKILCTNFNSYRGEIDIVAKDEKDLVFCEVKTRRNIEYGMPIEAVNYYKRKHLYATAEYYLYKNGIRNIPVRFDVIEVLLLNHKLTIHHVKDVM